MNFDLGEDEEMLKALVERFVADRYDIEKRRGFLLEPQGFSSDNWALLGELGLISACFDSAHGGLGIDVTGIATVFEALGRGLVVEPLIENVVLAGRLFAATAGPAASAQWRDSLLTGARRIALAHAEHGSRNGSAWVQTQASGNSAGVQLTGHKSCVPAGAGADGYIVSARSGGNPGDQNGLGLYFVPAGAAGLSLEGWRMADGSAAVSLKLDTVAVAPEHVLAGGLAEIVLAQELANLARAAEALGVMERIFAETQEYLRTRQQFGNRLASFQALQHRMVAQYVTLEQARSLLYHALVSAGSPRFGPAVAGVRAFLTDTSIQLGHEMIQFHGGMGVTDELSIGHGHKRLLVLSRWPDSPTGALDRFAGLIT